MHPKHLVALLVLPALLLPAAAQPPRLPAGACTPGPTYDPACDVNHDGSLDISDIQLTAGHWNQSGTWTSDNNHIHLGQTWSGTETPLTIQGAFSAFPAAPLSLSNSAGDGLHVTASGGAGVRVDQAATDGLFVNAVQANGLVVTSAGAAGVRVASTTYDGFYVGMAGGNGLTVNNAGADGVYVDTATHNGLTVNAAAGSGVYANTTQAAGEWGLYTDDKIYGSNITLASVSLVAQAAGPEALAAGDLVAAAGMAPPLPGSSLPIPLVRLAHGPADTAIGVVESRLERQGTTGELHRADGSVKKEAYVALTILGVTRVKVAVTERIGVGQRLTASDRPGQARALRSLEVQGVRVAEDAPVIGVALEDQASGAGSIWMLVNPR